MWFYSVNVRFNVEPVFFLRQNFYYVFISCMCIYLDDYFVELLKRELYSMRNQIHFSTTARCGD